MDKYSFEYLGELIKRHCGDDIFTHGVSETLKLAIDHHSGQFRDKRLPSDNDIPYIVHPVWVAIFSMKYFDGSELPDDLETVFKASLAHDLFEDTNLRKSTLTRIAGHRVTELVTSLTKPALVPPETHYDRNNRFLSIILEAGPTAMYIKACDSLHNISRPSQTPVKLLKKAVQKAENSYLPFVKLSEFNPALLQDFREKLASAKNHSEHIELASLAPSTFLASEVFSEALARTTHKLLELHDISDFLLEFTGATLCKHSSISEFVSNLADSSWPRSEFKRVSSGLKRHDRNLIKPSAEVKKVLPEDTSLLVLIPSRVESHSGQDQYFFLCFTDLTKPDWVDSVFLSALVVLLSERLRQEQNEKYAKLALDASSLGIELSENDLRNASVSYPDLVFLKKYLVRADEVSAGLQGLLRDMILHAPPKFKNFELTSRIKMPKSILRKVAKRGFGTVYKLDDIVGFRFVCLNHNDAVELRDVLVSELQSSRSWIGVSETPEDMDILSNDGYRAIHIKLRHADKRLSKIGCELQIRTVFQDAWAKASHLAAYHKNFTKSEARLIRKNLAKLAELREEADAFLIDFTQDL
ncbi:MAG: hypothetical protein AAF092_03610 [Pseudomonadota bacterium]